MWVTVVAVALSWLADGLPLHVSHTASALQPGPQVGPDHVQPPSAPRSQESRAAALIQEARREQAGERFERAIALLLEAEPLVFPDGPYMFRRDVLVGLGAAHGELGRYDHALSLFAALDRLAHEHKDSATEALAKYNVITARRKQMEELPDPEQLAPLVTTARALVDLADASGAAVQQARAHRTLGDLIASYPETRAEAGRHYRIALAAARRGGDRSELSTCLWVLGRFYADDRSAESLRLINEALQEALASGRATAIAYAWRQRLRLAWKISPPAEASDISMRALQAIEALRSLQTPGSTRASAFAAWTLDYHWLIGKLLEDPEPDRRRISLAFEASERMRARALLDRLSQQAPPPSPEARQLAERRRQLLTEITGLQRRLLDPALGPEARQRLLVELEPLEREEGSVRGALHALGDLTARDTIFQPLERVAQALAPNEAMLSFSVGLDRNFYEDFGGAASILVITREGTSVVRIPDRVRLRPVLSVFRGLIENGAGVDPRSSVALYQMILRDALATLPAGVTRLLVVPDGPLHHVPFAVLKPSLSASELGTTYEISVVPSATVWLRLKTEARTAPGDALVFADPVRTTTARAEGAAQRGGWLSLSDLGALPFSRDEGRAVIRHVGGGSRLLIGPEATESALKASRLATTGVLHFATHALVDEQQPDRSAILLAGDVEHNDGLLQAREIADLPLEGRLVVLSACRSATGAVLSGEGVMGLSRAFLEAGASAVVGTLWAIRDDHAATFFEGFYDSLRAGRTVGGALLEARRLAVAAGVPAAAWSSVIVIGDDTMRPIPASSGAAASRPVAAVVIAVSLLAAAVGGALVARRRFRRS